MRCEAVRALLDRYLEEQLTEVQKQHLEEHLGKCESCDYNLKSSRGFMKLLDECMQWARTPESHLESIYFNVSKAGRTRRSKSSGTALGLPRGGSGKRSFAVVASGLLILAVVWVLLQLEDGALSGRVLELSGSVLRLTTNQGWIPVEDGESLKAGDRINVEPGARVRIELPDRSNIELVGGASGSEAELQASEGGCDLLLARGEIRCVLSPTEPRPFSLITEIASVEVDREDGKPSRFSVQLEGGTSQPGTLIVHVEKGGLEVSNGQGSVRVPAGKASETKRGKAPGPPRDPSVFQKKRAGPNRKKTGRDDIEVAKNPVPSRPKPSSEVPPRENSPAAITKPSIDELISISQDGTDPTRQATAIMSLQLAVASTDSVSRIVDAILATLRASGDVTVRTTCVDALAKIGKKGGAEVGQGLTDTARSDSSPTVRVAALKGLSGLVESELYAEVVAEILRGYSDDSLMREAATIARRLKSADLEIVLVEIARDSARSLTQRKEALSSLSYYSSVSCVEALVEVAGDFEREVASAAVASLRILSGKSFALDSGSTQEEYDRTLEAIRVWWDEARAGFGSEEASEAGGGG